MLFIRSVGSEESEAPTHARTRAGLSTRDENGPTKKRKRKLINSLRGI